jgi:hypothetical protein
VRGGNDAARKAMLQLPLDRKETLLKSHRKQQEKQQGKFSLFKSGNSLVGVGGGGHGNQNNKNNQNQKNYNFSQSDFLERISKTNNLTPDQLMKMLNASKEEKVQFMMLGDQGLEGNQAEINAQFLDLLLLVKSSSPNEMQILLKMNLSERQEYISQNLKKPTTTTASPPVIAPDKSCAWFILKLTDRNLSLKTLFKHLQALRGCFLLQGGIFVSDFISMKIPAEDELIYSGVDAIEVVLERVNALTLARNDSNRSVWYADRIFPAKIVLEAIKCIEIMTQTNIGMFAILGGNIVVQIVRSLAVPRAEEQEDIRNDPKCRLDFLQVVTSISNLLGPACFIHADLSDRICSIMHDLKRIQQETLPFMFLISSLRNPFSFIVSGERVDEVDEQYLLLEYSSIWDFRTRLVSLFNVLVSSGEELSTRMRRRDTLERAGLRGILRSLVQSTAPEEFRSQVALFFQDREEDADLLHKQSRDKAVDVDDSIRQLQSMFQKIQIYPNATTLNWIFSSTLKNLSGIVESAPNGSEYNNLREDVSSMLSLIESLTKTMNSTLSSFDKSSEGKLLWHSNFYDTIIDKIGLPNDISLVAKPHLDQDAGKLDRFLKEIQRLQLLVRSLREEKENKSLMRNLNSEVEAAIHMKMVSNPEMEESLSIHASPQPSPQPSSNPSANEDLSLIVKSSVPMKV